MESPKHKPSKIAKKLATTNKPRQPAAAERDVYVLSRTRYYYLEFPILATRLIPIFFGDAVRRMFAITGKWSDG
jgi:hypothetical protein